MHILLFFLVYLRADAKQYNYKMYRPRCTYYVLGCSYNHKQFTVYGDDKMNGAQGVPTIGSRQYSVQMEITSRECYGFCVISSMIWGMPQSLFSM